MSIAVHEVIFNSQLLNSPKTRGPMTTTPAPPMTGAEIVDLCRKHTLYEWSAQSKVAPIPVARAKGIYFWTPEGKRFIDFNSQLMSVNIGHSDQRVIAAIIEQLGQLPYANPFMAHEPRARLGAKLAEITPGDIDTFFFTNGGAEATENAIKIARSYTGRHKILARYRSYHAQYRQATPNTAVPDAKTNPDGKNNYVWMEASGRGHFVGVSMSVFENDDRWWGEGDDMFFVDGEKMPSINGTGSEDYFLGAWDFAGKPFSYQLFGAPVVGPEKKGSKWSLYRFHLDSPITFQKSLRATIEHGTSDDRGDNFYSVAYWYQTEPHGSVRDGRRRKGPGRGNRGRRGLSSARCPRNATQTCQ